MLWLFQMALGTWSVIYHLSSYNESSTYLFIAESCDYPLDIIWIWLFINIGSALTESYEEFEHVLYQSGKELVKDHINFVDRSWEYNYLLQYVTKYPLTIRFGTITLTKRNAIQLLLLYSFARFLSYSAEYLYE